MLRQIHWFRTSVYVIAQLLQRAFNVLLLPLLVTQMSPTEFTRYGLLNSILILLSPIVTLNIYLGPTRLYFDYSDESQSADLLFTALISSAVTSVVSLLGLIGFLGVFNANDPITLGDVGSQILISAIITVLMVNDFYAVVLRIDGKALPFLGVSTLRQILLLGAFIVLTLFMNAFDSFLVALAFSGTIAALAGFLLCRRKMQDGRFRWEMLRQLLPFSTPTVIHMTAWWAILSSGRWIGQLYISLDDLAPYVLVTQITLITNMFSRALFEAQLPSIGSAFARNDISAGVRTINVTVLAAGISMAVLYLGLYIVVFVFGLPLPTGYQPTPALVFFAFLGAIFDAVYLRAVQINQAMKRNDLQALITVISGIVTVLISFPLTSAYGENGLIFVFAVGIGVQAVLSNMVAQKVLRDVKITT